MRALFTSDLHLTDRPKDEYRWEIFDWLVKHARNREVDSVFILGDITDQKDHHSNVLINRIIENLKRVAKICRVIGIKGNHDYIDPNTPLLKFLTGEAPNNILFAVMPMQIQMETGEEVLLLPNTRSWLSEWEHINYDVDLICTHQTYSGSKASNGFELEGMSPEIFGAHKTKAVVISGDIHVPQRVGRITYCGSPYPVAFGDSFQPRVLFLDGGELKSIPRTTIKKIVAEIESVEGLTSEALGLTPGDQVKVIFKLPRSEFGAWSEHVKSIREMAEKLEIDLQGVELRELKKKKRLMLNDAKPTPAATHMEVVSAFCRAKGVDDVLADVGRGLVLK